MKSMDENPDFLTLYFICDVTLIHKQKVQDHEISVYSFLLESMNGPRAWLLKIAYHSCNHG